VLWRKQAPETWRGSRPGMSGERTDRTQCGQWNPADKIDIVALHGFFAFALRIDPTPSAAESKKKEICSL
jgi:hypothetical protein